MTSYDKMTDVTKVKIFTQATPFNITNIFYFSMSGKNLY